MNIEALVWITGLLADNEVPYLICGGLAAFAYGSKRAINDIDIFVPEEKFDQVVSLGKKHVSKPAKHYLKKAEGWNVKYVQFKYKETKIEVGSSKGVEIFDTTSKQWIELRINFSRIEYRSVYGIRIPLMDRENLISYKKALGRSVDIQDVEAMCVRKKY
jgi:hypothetical protein